MGRSIFTKDKSSEEGSFGQLGMGNFTLRKTSKYDRENEHERHRLKPSAAAALSKLVTDGYSRSRSRSRGRSPPPRDRSRTDARSKSTDRESAEPARGRSKQRSPRTTGADDRYKHRKRQRSQKSSGGSSSASTLSLSPAPTRTICNDAVVDLTDGGGSEPEKPDTNARLRRERDTATEKSLLLEAETRRIRKDKEEVTKFLKYERDTALLRVAQVTAELEAVKLQRDDALAKLDRQDVAMANFRLDQRQALEQAISATDANWSRAIKITGKNKFNNGNVLLPIPELRHTVPAPEDFGQPPMQHSFVPAMKAPLPPLEPLASLSHLLNNNSNKYKA